MGWPDYLETEPDAELEKKRADAAYVAELQALIKRLRRQIRHGYGDYSHEWECRRREKTHLRVQRFRAKRKALTAADFK